MTEFELSPDGRFALFLADAKTDEEFDLYGVWLDNPSTLRRLNDPLSPGRDVRDFELSPDGTMVLYNAVQEALLFPTDIFAVPVDGSTGSRQLNGSVPGKGRVLDFEITPDGERVVFQASRALDDVFELFVAETRGRSPPVRLNEPLVAEGDVVEFWISPYDLTPDERNCVFIAEDELGVNRLYAAPLRGQSEPVRLNGTLIPFGDVLGFRVTSGGDRVVYLADQDTDGVNELYTSLFQTSPVLRR